MDLDPETCWNAIASRDARFDGRFFTAVKTTGIYCRPICPARTPRSENCAFYPCAAAAEEAGFRPCLRCRPDAAPGSPAWLGTGVTVRRALRAIDEGALDGSSVEALAASLGMGARHLRRLFRDELGCSPLALALTRRVHFARRLIEETDLGMTEVALAAGFGSLRSFNAAFKSTFGRAPRMLRRPGARPDSPITLALAHEEPYALAPLLAFLERRAIPGVETVGPGPRYRRTFRWEGRAGSLEVRAARGALELEVPAWATSGLLRIVARVRRIFDLDADSKRIDAHLARDPRLAPLVRARPGLRVPGAWDGFEVAVRAVLGQQVSVKGATTLAGRLAARFGERVNPAGATPGEVSLLFPERAALATAPVEEIGLPRARAASIRALAASSLTFTEPDLEERLRALPGIGPWTASYVALRMGEPDAFPASDRVLQRALGARAEERVSSLRPWRGYAALHIWTESA